MVAVVVVEGRSRGRLPQLVIRRKAIEGDPALVDLDDAGEDSAQGLELMGDDQHRCSARGQSGENLAQDLLTGQVDAGGGLVHDQDVGLGGQGPGDQHATLLATGEGAHIDCGPVIQSDDGKGLLDDSPVLVVRPAQPALVGEPPDRDDLRDGRANGSGQGMPLRHVPEAGMVVETVDRRAEEGYLAAEVVVEAEQPLDQCRLAGTVGAQYRDDLTGMDVQGDVGDHRAVGIPAVSYTHLRAHETDSYLVCRLLLEKKNCT